VIEVKERTRRPGEELYDETVTSKAAEESATLRFLDRAAKSAAPRTHKTARAAKRYITGGESVPSVGDIVWSAARGILNYVFPKTSEKYGPRVFGKHWDPQAYAIVEKAVADGISGNYRLEHVPAEYGSWKLKYKGRDVWGRQDGKRAYFIQDPEKAIGAADEHTKKAVQDYVKFHEEAEAAYQAATGKAELSEFDHGKVQAYVLKSLKSLGREDVYRVGVSIDGRRKDIFGHYIREHATEDVRRDLHEAAFRKALALAGA
jgi:hypothetical protein